MAEQLRFLGKIIPNSATNVDRDAFHVAVIPCIGGKTGKEYERLSPGDPVKLMFGTTNMVTHAEYHEKEAIGIIDPFIGVDGQYVDNLIGKRFYVWLFPGTVTGMRHHWEHPAFNEEKIRKESEASDAELWLHRFAEKWGFDYNDMIKVATDPTELSEHGWQNDYIVAHGIDLHDKEELGGDYVDFWYNLEQLTGKKFGEEHKEKVGWSCSC